MPCPCYNYNSMGSKNWLNKVAELHEEWVKIASVHGAGIMAEDMVQDSYLKLIKYNCQHQVIKDGEVKKGFMFFVVRNTVYNFHKKKEIKYTYDIPKNLPDNELSEYEEAYNDFCNKVDNVSMEWARGYRQVFNHYRFEGDSIRSMADQFGISTVTIFNRIKECKNHIRYELKEDWQDLQNGDYDKI